MLLCLLFIGVAIDLPISLPGFWIGTPSMGYICTLWYPVIALRTGTARSKYASAASYLRSMI